LHWQLACLQQVRRIDVPGRRGLCEPGSCRRLVDGRVVRCKRCQRIRRAWLALGCGGLEQSPRTLCILADSEAGQVQGAQQVLRAWITGQRVCGEPPGRIRKLLEAQRALGRLERIWRREFRWSRSCGLHCTECAERAERANDQRGQRRRASTRGLTPSHTSSPREFPLAAGNPRAGCRRR
jgi:hypothetical protein